MVCVTSSLNVVPVAQNTTMPAASLRWATGPVCPLHAQVLIKRRRNVKDSPPQAGGLLPASPCRIPRQVWKETSNSTKGYRTQSNMAYRVYPAGGWRVWVRRARLGVPAGERLPARAEPLQADVQLVAGGRPAASRCGTGRACMHGGGHVARHMLQRCPVHGSQCGAKVVTQPAPHAPVTEVYAAFCGPSAATHPHTDPARPSRPALSVCTSCMRGVRQWPPRGPRPADWLSLRTNARIASRAHACGAMPAHASTCAHAVLQMAASSWAPLWTRSSSCCHCWRRPGARCAPASQPPRPLAVRWNARLHACPAPCP